MSELPKSPVNKLAVSQGALAPTLDPGIRQLVMEALEDGSWSQYDAKWTAALTDTLTQQFSTKFVRLASSGTIAVELALRGVGVQSGDEVILAAYDFPGNFRAIEAIGALPVLVDVVPNGWTLDLTQLDQARSEKTRAILVSHLHGQLAAMPGICDWAKLHQVKVVEDACQVPGANLAGHPAGSWGDAGTLSFGGSKLLSAGRGGAVLTRYPEVMQRMVVFADRGNDSFPLSQLQAAVLLPQLKSLEGQNRLRNANVNRLRSLLAENSSIELLPASEEPDISAYYKVGFFVAPTTELTPARVELISNLTEQGLEIGEGFRGFYLRSDRRCRKVGSLVHATNAAEHTMLLHHTVLLQEPNIMDRVSEVISNAVR